LIRKAIILDTQAFLYSINCPDKISIKALKYLDNTNYELYLSIASIWEMGIKSSIKKLKFEVSLKEIIQTSINETGLRILPIKPEHIYYIETLKFHHKDPFDRIILAQSILEEMPIVSNDGVFDNYNKVKRIW
jgi:PIN domain nuclease of toxin-antitoxin system